MPSEEHYDDSASLYFGMSVLVIILVPTSFSYLKVWRDAFDNKYNGFCGCANCRTKAEKLKKAARRPSGFGILKFILWIGVWVLFLYLLHTATSRTNATESVQFDPYAILEIDQGTPVDEVKKAYRKLSLKWHPDKNPDPTASDRYILIAKAHETLTDPETKEKWEKYGNPDGPQGFSVGIALPSFLVEGKNSLAVLAVYILFLVIIFPTVAICWWQRQKELAPNQLMTKTLVLYYQTVRENMRFKKLLEILSLSFEYTSVLPIRRSDEIILQKLKPLIPPVGDDQKKVHKSKKRTLLPHVAKHVMLFYAHFSRLHDQMGPLLPDLDVLLKHAHRLIIGMVENCVNMRRFWLTPTLEAIQISQMIAQGVWGDSSKTGLSTSLLQIPHMTETMMSHLNTKKLRIATITQFIAMGADKRREFLLGEGLSEAQIQDIDNVIKRLPWDVELHHRCEVDEDDANVGITGGSIVTLVATFDRPSLPQPGAKAEDSKTNKEKDQVDDETTVVSKSTKQTSKQEDPFKPPKLNKDEQPIEAHAPYFPEKKNELWWLIVGDERANRILGLTRIACLMDKTEVRIPFPVPRKSGIYAYTIFLMSDSYVGFDKKKVFKLNVAKELQFKPKERTNEDDEFDENLDDEEQEDQGNSEEEKDNGKEDNEDSYESEED